ncbi:hypothetical protein [Paenibacillus qinlingensis]|uniref:Na+/melibiose symporter-like transporter n=1 Tax=Paenibacillus qinlingensis TaxID=1837343 RepID=A0ABU1P4J5_9BACL|nr:hypothetical protein [Paenibacillus qinlingensis]MDR6554667.1 Na+/melibiose symporter-like transporter [Paenibacillus qinlingensis]
MQSIFMFNISEYLELKEKSGILSNIVSLVIVLIVVMIILFKGGSKMARTYHAEGRQVAYIIRGISVLTGLSIFFYTDLKQIWWMFFVIIFSSILLGEIFGSRWTKKRRADRKDRNKTEANSSNEKSSKQ